MEVFLLELQLLLGTRQAVGKLYQTRYLPMCRAVLTLLMHCRPLEEIFHIFKVIFVYRCSDGTVLFFEPYFILHIRIVKC